MSGINPSAPISPPIIPPEAVSDPTIYIPGYVLALTTFVLGTVLILLVAVYILMKVFGRPIDIAKSTVTSGHAIIQHHDTSKSGVFKTARISGDSFRYADVRDGTVAATTKSVNNLMGRNIVLTYAQLGLTIPTDFLTGISVLVHNGIHSIKELKESIMDTEQSSGRKVSILRHRNIVSGYTFQDFPTLLKEMKEDKLVPLIIEAVPNFVSHNVSAAVTEKKIIIRQIVSAKYLEKQSSGNAIGLMATAIGVILILIVGMAIK